MELELLSFAPFLEIIGGLNFAYAGSQSFRVGLNRDVLNIKSTLEEAYSKLEEYKKKINEIKSFLIVSIAEIYNNDEYKNRINKYGDDISDKLKELENRCENLKRKEEKERDFSDGFKSMFLISGIFCLILLLFLGYKQFYSKNIGYQNIMINCLMWMSSLLLINIWIFLRSFFKKYHNKEIKLIYIVLLFTLTIIFGFKLSINFLNFGYLNPDKVKISFSILLTISPYLLHLIRVFIHKIKYRLTVRFMLYKFYLNVRVTIEELIIQKYSTEQYDIGTDKTFKGAFKHFFMRIKYIYHYRLNAILNK